MVAKNLATINDSILVQPGNSLSIYSQRGILAKATVAEHFPVQIGIYSLSTFLGVVALFKEPEFDFQDSFVRIYDSTRDATVRYLYTAPSCIHPKLPKTLRPIPPETIEFDLLEEKWAAIQKAAAVLGKNEIRIRADVDGIAITTYDHKNPNGHEFSSHMRTGVQRYRCNIVIQIENLTLLKGSYHVTVTPAYTMFVNQSGYRVGYWVGCDPASTFE